MDLVLAWPGFSGKCLGELSGGRMLAGVAW